MEVRVVRLGKTGAGKGSWGCLGAESGECKDWKGGGYQELERGLSHSGKRTGGPSCRGRQYPGLIPSIRPAGFLRPGDAHAAGGFLGHRHMSPHTGQAGRTEE